VDFEALVLRTIARERLVGKGDRVVVALSGGPDSRALLQFFIKNRESLGISVDAFHLDHGQRPESLQEARQLRSLCGELGVGCFFYSTSVPRLCRMQRISLEEGGRKARLHYIRKVRALAHPCRIATGHHLDDCAETVLMNLLRGSASRGLSGMRYSTEEGIIRPFLDVTREDILEWCKRENLTCLHDPTNDDMRFLRNRIRAQLIPLLLRDYSPALARTLRRMSQVIAEEDDMIEDLARRALDDMTVERAKDRLLLDRNSLLSMHPALARRVLRLAVIEFRADPRDVSSALSERLLRLVRQRTGAAVPVGKNVLALSSYDSVIIESVKCLSPKRPDPVAIRVPGVTDLPDFGISITTELVPTIPDLTNPSPWEAWMDWERAGERLEVRTRREGDLFHPFGLGGRKKLKRFLIDEKVPRSARDTLPLITARGEIAWIPGMRQDERFGVSPATRKVLHARVEKRKADTRPLS
jgi:tRNA(Ile)-lysidine synthase